MTTLSYVLLPLGILAGLAALYGLHRWLLALERRGYIYYWHQKPQGGSTYVPLQELVHPQIRHVIEVSEQVAKSPDDESGSGSDSPGDVAD